VPGWDLQDVCLAVGARLCGVSHEALLRRRVLHAGAAARGRLQGAAAGWQRGGENSRGAEEGEGETAGFIWRRALEVGNMTSWALLLALAVSVLVPSSTHPALHPAPLLPRHATASHGLSACPFASCSVLFFVAAPLQDHAITSAWRGRSQRQRRGQPTASALRDRHAPRRRMHQPTQDLHPSVSTHISSASAQ
jgi:hypothetical protein